LIAVGPAGGRRTLSDCRSWVGGSDELRRRPPAAVDSLDFSEETLESVTSDDTATSIIDGDS